MASLTDKMPLKDFNAIFKNDELAKEISQLIEKANSTKKLKNEIRYSREELVQIGKNPMCQVPKAVFSARLTRSNLSDNIINSLLRKSSLEQSQSISDSQENVNSDFFDDNAQNYNRYKNNVRNAKNRDNTDGGYRENAVNSRYDREKNYRSNNSDAVQCWRTEKTLHPNNRNTTTKREYQDSRYTQSRNSYDRYNQRKGYGNRNGHGYKDDYEEEPEWFSNGPESMNDFIDLKGFDDDEKCVDNDRPELSAKCNSVDLSGHNSGEMFESSKNESFNRNLSTVSDNINSMLSMDVSNLFNSSNVSFLENKDINDFPLPFSFGDLANASNTSSRAEKWFKNKKESVSAEDSLQNASSKTTSPLTVGSDKSGSIMDLFQNVNMKRQSANNLAGIKVDLSKATSLADLEASLLNSAPAKKSENISQQNGSVQDSAVMSKLMSLAGQQEPKANIPNDGPLHLPPMNHFTMNEPFGRSLSGSQQQPPVPNNPPIFPNYNPLAGHPPAADRMLHPSFFKGNGAPSMPPFPYGEGNLPFPVDNMHPRPLPFFGQPIPPEMAHQFVGQNSFVPGFMPNGPFAPPMMGHLNQMPPALTAQMFAQLAMMQQQQQQQQQPPPPPHMNLDAAKSKMSDESNLADKLLKNSKFTPTSVFRKLKDHDQNKVKSSTSKAELQVKSELDMLSAAVKSGEIPFEMNKEPPRNHMSLGDISNIRAPNTIPHPLSNYHIQPPNDKNTSDMAQLLQQLNLNRAPNLPLDLKPNHISLNPSDIFNAMRKGEHSAASMPPLPMMNALKLEDLEKF